MMPYLNVVESNLSEGLEYCGTVVSVRQRYFLFEAGSNYFLVCFSSHKPDMGYVNRVSKNAVRYVYRCFEKNVNVTAKEVVDRARRTRHARDPHTARNILYVLTVLGQAIIDEIGDHQELFFKIN
jgi:hypothetical protein